MDKEIIGLYKVKKEFYESPLREGTPRYLRKLAQTTIVSNWAQLGAKLSKPYTT